MKTKRAEVTLTSVEDYVRLMNSFFNLTDMEIRVLCEFIKERIRRSKDPNKYNTHLFHHSVKDKISRSEFDRSNHYWINGYVKDLKEKGALISMEENGHYQINKGLIPSGESKIIININWKTDER